MTHIFTPCLQTASATGLLYGKHTERPRMIDFLLRLAEVLGPAENCFVKTNYVELVHTRLESQGAATVSIYLGTP